MKRSTLLILKQASKDLDTVKIVLDGGDLLTEEDLEMTEKALASITKQVGTALMVELLPD